MNIVNDQQHNVNKPRKNTILNTYTTHILLISITHSIHTLGTLTDYTHYTLTTHTLSLQAYVWLTPGQINDVAKLFFNSSTGRIDIEIYSPDVVL